MKPVYKIFFVSLCASACLINSDVTRASSVPSSADPGRSLSEQQNKPLKFQKPEAERSPTRAEVPNAPEGSEKTFFTLKSIQFEGMSAYTAAQISSIYSGDLGQNISVARLFEIMNEVQKRYLDDGYSLSRVILPTQDVSNGTVLLQVIEGYAAEVEFEGNIAKNPVIEDALNRIGSMRPLNTKELERILLILNDMPNFNVTAILGAIQGPIKQQGAIRLTLKQIDRAYSSATWGLNNFGSDFSGPFQSFLTSNIANTIHPFDEFAATFSATIPAQEMKYLGARYSIPIAGVSGANLSLEANIGRTAPGSTIENLEVRGKSNSIKLELSYPLIRQRDESLRFKAGVEARHTKTNLLSSRLYDDRLRIFSMGATYNNSDSYDGLNAFEITYSQGLNVLGVRKAGSSDLSRSDGRPDFRKILVSFGRIQSLPQDFDVMLTFQGQYSYDPLLSSEEFGFGGGQMGRGYDPSEITGDRGIAAAIELRKNFMIPPLNAAGQGYLFYDVGKVWNIDPSSKNRVSAAASGIGFRSGLESGWSWDINFSTPLTKNSENPPNYTNGAGSRILLSLQKKFN